MTFENACIKLFTMFRIFSIDKICLSVSEMSNYIRIYIFTLLYKGINLRKTCVCYSMLRTSISYCDTGIKNLELLLRDKNVHIKDSFRSDRICPERSKRFI